MQHTKAITYINYRMTLMDLNNVHMSEGEWTPAAYQQALRRA
ncbi:MAG: hypothetical protein U0903_15630 [Planctomycetales bacterium]